MNTNQNKINRGIVKLYETLFIFKLQLMLNFKAYNHKTLFSVLEFLIQNETDHFF